MKEKTRRLFFAINPSESEREKLHDVQRIAKRDHRAKWIPPKNFHLTLCFIGAVEQAKIDCLMKQSQPISFEPFTLSFNHFGVFKRAGILWLGLDSEPTKLLELHNSVKQVASNCGIDTEARQFRPHISLARKYKSRIPQQNFSSIELSVNSFHLMESVPIDGGVEYVAQATFHKNSIK